MKESLIHQRKHEVMSVLVLLLLIVLTPLFIDELYPFSSFRLYFDSPQVYCKYKITDQDGNTLTNHEFRLQRIYYGVSLEEQYGKVAPATTDHFGRVADPLTITKQVRKILNYRPQTRWVSVTQQVIGAVDDQKIGVIKEQTWRVMKTTRKQNMSLDKKISK